MPLEQRAKLGVREPETSNKDLLADLRKCAKELGRTPGHTAFDKYLGRKGSQMLQLRYGTWANACEAAGLEPNLRPASERWGERAYSDEQVIGAYERIRALTGGPPTLREWAKLQAPGEISCHALRRRCNNSWVAFLREMEELLTAEDLPDPGAGDPDRASDLGLGDTAVDQADQPVAAAAL